MTARIGLHRPCAPARSQEPQNFGRLHDDGIEDSRLSPRDKVILLALTRVGYQSFPIARISHADLAGLVKITPRHLSRCIVKLERLGYVSQERDRSERGAPRFFRMLFEFVGPYKLDSESADTPRAESASNRTFRSGCNRTFSSGFNRTPMSGPTVKKNKKTRTTTPSLSSADSQDGAMVERVRDMFVPSDLLDGCVSVFRDITPGMLRTEVVEYGEDWVRRAVEISREWRPRRGDRNSKPPWSYCLGILANFKKAGGPPSVPERVKPAPRVEADAPKDELPRPRMAAAELAEFLRVAAADAPVGSAPWAARLAICQAVARGEVDVSQVPPALLLPLRAQKKPAPGSVGKLAPGPAGAAISRLPSIQDTRESAEHQQCARVDSNHQPSDSKSAIPSFALDSHRCIKESPHDSTESASPSPPLESDTRIISPRIHSDLRCLPGSDPTPRETT